MGDWNISIRGSGIHDNGLKEDVEHMVTEFVTKLKLEGHNVFVADIVIGGVKKIAPTADSLSPPTRSIHDK